MVWFLIPVAGSIGAAGAIYSLHAATNATSIYVAQKAHGESFDFVRECTVSHVYLLPSMALRRRH